MLIFKRILDMTTNTSFIAYFDGACEPVNPGGTASFGVAIFQAGEPVWESSEIYRPQPGHEKETLNNVAEYAGLIAVLEWFVDHDLLNADITVRDDSQLVINQTFGTWKIKGGHYAPLAYRARELQLVSKTSEGEWIRRDQNGLADRLSKDALKGASVKLRLQPA
jgi:ribonuclease HI